MFLQLLQINVTQSDQLLLWHDIFNEIVDAKQLIKILSSLSAEKI